VGDFEVTLGLVEEAVTWFADAPQGGGPADGFLRVHIQVAAQGALDAGAADDAAVTEDGGPADDAAVADDAGSADDAVAPGQNGQPDGGVAGHPVVLPDGGQTREPVTAKPASSSGGGGCGIASGTGDREMLPFALLGLALLVRRRRGARVPGL
jgi:MYXO-CTERM domain-containing protein